MKFVNVVFETNQKPFPSKYRLGFQERQLFISRMQVGFSRETGFSLRMQLFISRMQVGYSRETGFWSSNAGWILERDRFLSWNAAIIFSDAAIFSQMQLLFLRCSYLFGSDSFFVERDRLKGFLCR